MKIKSLIYIVITLGLVFLIDLTFAIRQRLFGKGGTNVQFYDFNEAGDSLLKFISNKFNRNNSDLPFVTKVLEDQNNSGYTYVRLHSEKENENFHFWILTKKEEWRKGSEIVFFGISQSENFEDCSQINLENFISRRVKLNRFEKLIVTPLNGTEREIQWP
jgi:hypothetical protein